MRIQFTVIPENGCSVAGRSYPKGTHEADVTKEELVEIKKKVATSKHRVAWEVAELMFQNRFNDELKNFTVRMDKYNRNLEAERMKKEITYSVSSEFSRIFPNGMPPIKDLKVQRTHDDKVDALNSIVGTIVCGLSAKEMNEAIDKSFKEQSYIINYNAPTVRPDQKWIDELEALTESEKTKTENGKEYVWRKAGYWFGDKTK
jgi:hypothetical protein